MIEKERCKTIQQFNTVGKTLRTENEYIFGLNSAQTKNSEREVLQPKDWDGFECYQRRTDRANSPGRRENRARSFIVAFLLLLLLNGFEHTETTK